jgi:hypothetical protein
MTQRTTTPYFQGFSSISVEVRYLGFKIFFVKKVVTLLVNEKYDGAQNTRGRKIREQIQYTEADCRVSTLKMWNFN